MLGIVIPYYKLTFFEYTLQSLARQTDKRFRVYVGDDASPENPFDLLEEYQDQFDFVYHRFELNIGNSSLTQQWERCVALSVDEEWLMILGDDDVLGENVVEEFYFFINGKKTDADLIRFNLRIIDKSGQLKSEDFEHPDHESTDDLLERMFLLKETITASEFVFSRTVYNKNNGFVNFPMAWFSDYATWLVFSKQTGIYNVQKAFVYWRLSGINISSKSVDIREIELKVESLFLFMSFLQSRFRITVKKQKDYTHTHLTNLLSNVTFWKTIGVLGKQCFRFKFRWAEMIIIEFVFRKIKRKIKRNYGGICSASKG